MRDNKSRAGNLVLGVEFLLANLVFDGLNSGWFGVDFHAFLLQLFQCIHIHRFNFNGDGI